ncbi:MAG: glycogen synthase GlgA [Verrucomicrobiales bacterium]
MNILLASSEVFPFSKTGGLADMVGALGKSLAERGHRVGIVTPLYRGITEKFKDLQPFDFRVDLPLGPQWIQARVKKFEARPNLTIYFIEQPGFYDRASLYMEDGMDYLDNAQRFIFLSKCVALLARYLDWAPEIVHIHDWQVGLVPLFIKHQHRFEGWNNIPASCITIHNLAYQGVFPAKEYNLTNLPRDYFQPEGVEYYGMLNCLKAGLNYSDMLTTVSPRYAREITTQALGCTLDGILRARQDALVGILNGVDYSEWNTESNPFLAKPYGPDDFSGKAEQKALLQKEMGLPIAPQIPLFGTVSRLADQKGVDIQIAALQEMLAGNMQFVLLGSGGAEYERGFRRLAERYPTKVGVKIGYDHGLAHRIEAGCDFFLMPSLFEPCGLNQMYSLRYGTIPVVRVTGGLDDSVIDINEDLESADGIKFFEYSSRALSKAIRKAIALYQNKELLQHYRVNGMKVDFSWSNTCAEYEKVYVRALEKIGKSIS